MYNLSNIFDRALITKREENYGVAIMLFLSPMLAKELAMSGGEPPEKLHLTICYIGDDITSIAPVKRALNLWAVQQDKITGKVQSTIEFITDDNKVLALHFDSPQLPKIHQSLVNSLRAMGIPYNPMHGFTPHITLKYYAKDAVVPHFHLTEPIEITFNNVTLGYENAHYTIPLGAR